MNRRRLLTLGMRGSIAAGVGAFGYGALIERRRPVIERIDCPISRAHAGLAGLTIAVMSDFHHDEFHDDTLMGKAIGACNDLQPDIVMLTGDFISRDTAGLDALADHFAHLRSRIGVFGILGNHDQWSNPDWIAGRLRKAGVDLLRNEHVAIQAPTGQQFVLAGLESAWAGSPRLDRAIRGVPGDVPVILGWHEPDPFEELNDERVALQLSGHTHGGQVCAPGWGAIQLPYLGRKYVAGLYRGKRASLYVTRGVGAMGVPVRFCCPPEITLITLKPPVAEFI